MSLSVAGLSAGRDPQPIRADFSWYARSPLARYAGPREAFNLEAGAILTDKHRLVTLRSSINLIFTGLD